MQSSCRLASATSRKIPAPRPRQCARGPSNDIDPVLLLYRARVGFAVVWAWREDTVVEEARKPTWPPSALAPGDRGGGCCSNRLIVRACGTPIIGPAGVSAGATLVRAACNDAVAAFGASGTIAASRGTSRSIALPTNTLDETHDARQRDMARSVEFERRQRC